MSDANTTTLHRVYIWSLPRTLGTALMKCLSYIDDVQVIYEPTVSAFYYGPDADLERQQAITMLMKEADENEVESYKAFRDDKCSYEWVKEQLTADYPDKRLLLVKDIVHCLDERYTMLPSGFRYAFLIRHPYRMLCSWKSVMARLLGIDESYVNMVDMQKYNNQPDLYEMQYNLFNYIKEHLDPNVVVIDADDLQNSPSTILSQFCQAVGIQYTDSLLKWPGDSDVIKDWMMSRLNLQANFLETGGFYDKALKSTGFASPKPLPERSELPKDVQEAADYSMKFYDKMREMCLKP